MLANGTFVKAALRASGSGIRNASTLKKGFLHVHDGKLYLLSHIQTIHHPELVGVVPMHGMRCVTFLVVADRFTSFTEITGGDLRGVRLSILHDSESVAAVHGSAASGRARVRQASTSNEPRPASADPYTLANYTRHMYEGFAGYHASHRVAMNTPSNGYTGYRIGVELETEFTNEAARAAFTGTPRNWYFCEADGSLRNSGCEIITIPLIPADAKSRATWKPLTDRLSGLGATSWDNNRCGLHVHIGREILGETEAERDATLSRILLFYNLYLNDDATATKVFGRSRCYNEHNHDNTQEFAAVKCLGAEVLKNKEIAKRVGDSMKRKQSAERYYTINTTNAATIEFRKGRGSLNPDRIQTIVTFCEAVCLYARTTEDVSEMTLDGFRAFIRATVPTTNALYYYYGVIEADR